MESIPEGKKLSGLLGLGARAHGQVHQLTHSCDTGVSLIALNFVLWDAAEQEILMINGFLLPLYLA